MTPDEYLRLERIARREGVSVAELFRRAVRERYTGAPAEAAAALEEIRGLRLPLGDWQSLEEEIALAHGTGLS